MCIFMRQSHCHLHSQCQWQPRLLTCREGLHLVPPPEHSSAQLSRGPHHQASNRNARATFCVYCGHLTTHRMLLSGVLEFHICKCQQTLTAASQPHPATFHIMSNFAPWVEQNRSAFLLIANCKTLCFLWTRAKQKKADQQDQQDCEGVPKHSCTPISVGSETCLAVFRSFEHISLSHVTSTHTHLHSALHPFVQSPVSTVHNLL